MRTYKFRNSDNGLIQKTESLEANFLDPSAILGSCFFFPSSWIVLSVKKQMIRL